MSVSSDPKFLRPGVRIMHRSGTEMVLSHRKDDDSGWWNEDGSGFDDRVLREDDDFALHPFQDDGV